MFQFHLGRTVTRFNKEFLSCEENIWNSNKRVNMSDVKQRNIPIWKKEIFDLSYRLIYQIDKRWLGSNLDFVVQFACMDNNSYIDAHKDKDVSSQFLVTFGEYSGGHLMLYNNEKHVFERIETMNNIVQFDGRKKHYVTKVKHGVRYSLVFYKSYDRRYKEQPIYNGVKLYRYV